jgi:DNA-directed RNA polymerase specialized sigma subunit
MSGVARNHADISQMESEAHVGLLKAIRGYTNLDFKFITYAYKAIFLEVSRYLQRSGNGLSGVNYSLLVKYKKKLEELVNQNVPHSFDDVCIAMNATKGQTSRLKLALRAQVMSENEMEEEIAGILVDNRRKTSVDLDFIRALAAVPMSSLEKDSWISSNKNVRELFPESFASQREVAAHYGVSYQAVSAAAKRAKSKLAASLRDFDPND